jgi:hypothetical protein
MPGYFPDLLFCDFDGCLHPGEVYRYRKPPIIRLKSPRHSLFESCEVLESLLAPYPELRIVLSTSWVRTFSFNFAKKQLTARLQARVIGATWHSKLPTASYFTELSRYAQIRDNVRWRRPKRWLALDDDDAGWDPADVGHLALMPADLGLSDTLAQAHLKDRLRAQFDTGESSELDFSNEASSSV